MKTKYISILILCLLCMGAIQAQTKSFKRGISYNIPTLGDAKALSDGLTWFYNWGYGPAEDISDTIVKLGLDYIPMTWNGGIQTETLRSYFRANPQIKYILAFNEPNFLEQANMTPSAAAAKWPEIEAIADEFGLKIVSPAVNYAPANGAVSENGVTYTDPVQWLDDFFAACPECRVDYIAIHCYMNYSSALKSYVNRFKKYGKPIWLTEFCAWESGVTDLLQRNYMAESVNYLESDPDVYRYSWFIGRAGGTGSYPYMQLLGRYEGQLTEKGLIYVNMSSFDDNYYHALNDTIQAEHYVQVADGVHLEQSTDVSGTLDLCDFLESRWAVYNVDVPETGDYKMSFRVATEYATQIQISLDGVVLAKQDIDITGGLNQWQTISTQIHLDKGKQKLRIEPSKGRINLNWLMFENGSSSIGSNDVAPVSLYPNPVKDILHIDSPLYTSYSLTDSAGKTLLSGNIQSQSINLTKLSSGVYFLSISTNDGQKQVKKLIKN
ncbi:MAG: glycosyl hydrolase [Dysgonomonas sp.]